MAVTPATRELVFDLAAEVRAAGRMVSFDPKLWPTLWRSQDEMIECLNRLLSLSDWVLPGLAEGRVLRRRPGARQFDRRAGRAVPVRLRRLAHTRRLDKIRTAVQPNIDKNSETIGTEFAQSFYVELKKFGAARH